MSKIKSENLADVILKEMEAYSDEIAEVVKDEVRKVAKECVDEIKKNAPTATGEYKRGWKTKVVYESANDIRVAIHNAKKPALAHLLEFGHAKVNGGRVDGKAHIRPAELNAEKKLLGRVRVSIK